MQSTTHYSLMKAEGTDTVNLLTQCYPNFDTIDAAMFANKQGSIGTATEVTTGTVHAITRNNADSDIFRFTATSAWTAGDTMTLDGVGVTVHLADGTTPATGAYIIGAEVLGVVNGSLVTLYLSSTISSYVESFNSRSGAVSPTASDYDASMIDYDNTVSGLNATDVQGAIDEIAGSVKMSVLWTNADPTVAFTPQNVVLSSDDYDLLMWLFFESTSAANGKSVTFSKGSGVIMDEADAGHNYIRVATRNSDTSYAVSDGYKDNSTDNTLLIPYKVYGIKF